MRPHWEKPLIHEEFEWAKGTPHNINLELDDLYRYGSLCKTIAELGVDVGFSTRAFLMAEPEVLISVDPVETPEIVTLREKIKDEVEGYIDWRFVQDMSDNITLEPVDMLFIDTDHTYTQVVKELARFGDIVKRYLVFHDTIVFGEEVNCDWRGRLHGIWAAVAEYMRENPQWIMVKHNTHPYVINPHKEGHISGLTIFANTAQTVPFKL